MNYERQKRLVERLLERTKASEMPWQESATEDVFQVSFPSNSVRISYTEEYGESIYTIFIIDSTGRTTDTFNNGDLDRDGPHRRSSWHSIMRELFTSARRYALGADKALDTILAEIG